MLRDPDDVLEHRTSEVVVDGERARHLLQVRRAAGLGAAFVDRGVEVRLGAHEVPVDGFRLTTLNPELAAEEV